MKLKLDELVDMFDEIQNYEYIVYDKKENNFIFIELNIMSMQEYEELTDKIEEDEEERYYYLPSSYVFHDSELIEEYINELAGEDARLLIEYNGEKMPVNLLKIMSESLLKSRNLSTEERAYQSAELTRIYYEKLKQLKNKIIALAVTETDNVYLAYIHSCITIINSLLKEYSHLLAVQKSSMYTINNSGNLNAGEKIKVLKDNIEIRTAEINTRLATDSLKR